MLIQVIAEGQLDEVVGKQLVKQCGHECGTTQNLEGCANVRNRAHIFHRNAHSEFGYLVLTDFRDAGLPCVGEALQSYLWQHVATPPPTFLYRFAVQELESWLMADREGLTAFFGIDQRNIPFAPDLESHPKQTLVNLARQSNRTRINTGVAPQDGHQASVGPRYLSIMTEFIENYWDIDRATGCSPSLQRCVQRLRDLVTGP